MRLHVFQNSIIEYVSWKKLTDVHMAAAIRRYAVLTAKRHDVSARDTSLSNPTSDAVCGKSVLCCKLRAKLTINTYRPTDEMDAEENI
jgi:hypothetical protein